MRKTLSSYVVSVPNRADPAQYLTASEPNSSIVSMGVITFPLDLLIFFLSGSNIQPEITTFFQGMEL